MAKAHKRIITPIGVLAYGWINSPDTKFDQDGVYSVKLAFDNTDADFQAFKQQIEAEAQAVFDSAKAGLKGAAKNNHELRTPFTLEYDDDGEKTGRVIAYAKQKARVKLASGETLMLKPTVYDSNGKPMSNPPSIYSGSKLRAQCEIISSPNIQGKSGVSLRLKSVQLVELVSGSSDGFGAVDGGYVATESDTYVNDDSNQHDDDFQSPTGGATAAADDDSYVDDSDF